ncbi:TIGR03084 family metal-binding protein [Streptomyces megasporus]|uniref:TIGR03084 family metal-binding protein n=1 Tax=Streptomyces megasporus TaxID=44060 RepID=UPI0004E174C9|nr:TIGR03084 family metal-binding protein [Streptomyces megasporus]
MSGTAADEVLRDLRDESEELDALVAPLAEAADERWRADTPSPGWTVAHQIAHLAWTDRRALSAVRDPETFRREAEDAFADPGAVDTLVDDGARRGAALPPGELLETWRAGRRALATALEESAARPGRHRLPWYGPPMSVAGMATARLMETWAHGEDVAETLGVRRAPTARLRHVARLGARTRDFAYAVNGLEPPAEPFRVELTPPPEAVPDTRARWAYGPEDAPQRVSGPALDFCLLVTRRVHRDDTALRAEGADAERWLGIAQAFAGPPGAGREPGTRDVEGPR